MIKRPDWTYGFIYRLVSRLLHRVNLHHTKRRGPMEDGTYVIRCDWCGLSRIEVPMHITEARMREGRTTKR